MDQETLEREMRLVIGHLQTFAENVKSGLHQADWQSRREIICGLVKRVEVEQDQVRVVYRVEPGPSPHGSGPGTAQNCLRRFDPNNPFGLEAESRDQMCSLSGSHHGQEHQKKARCRAWFGHGCQEKTSMLAVE